MRAGLATKHGFTRGAFRLACLTPLTFPAAAYAVNWELQAERLERISAALLDGVPISEPPSAKYGVGVKFDVSLLPKPNPQIGSKKETVPSSPLHTVPTVKGYVVFSQSKKLKLGVNAYAGYLVPGLEGIVGVKAKLSQYSAGLAGTMLFGFMRSFTLTTDLGVHLTGGTLQGAITSPDSKDSFAFSTKLFYLTPGVLYTPLGLFANFLLGYKSTEAELKIPSDDTDLKTKDTLQDAPLPIVFQLAAGYRHRATGLSAGLAYLVVPSRLYMPRIHLGWIHPLGTPKSAAQGNTKGTKAGAPLAAEPNKGKALKKAKTRGSQAAPTTEPAQEFTP